MWKMFMLMVLATVTTVFPSFANAEEILKRTGKQYLGWEFPNTFKTCRGAQLSIAQSDQIIPTALTCPTGSPSGPTVALIRGTVTNTTERSFTIKDSAGTKHEFFVPTLVETD